MRERVILLLLLQYTVRPSASCWASNGTLALLYQLPGRHTQCVHTAFGHRNNGSKRFFRIISLSKGGGERLLPANWLAIHSHPHKQDPEKSHTLYSDKADTVCVQKRTEELSS